MPTASPARKELSLLARLGVAGSGLLLLTLLAVAAGLRPDPRGYGTHQQLGLPACSFRRFVGRRCPSCGMTTAWSHMMQGEIGQSLEANAAGTLLATVALVVAPWLLASGLRGRWVVLAPHATWGLALTIAVMVVALLHWALRLGR